jgi:hypothetical protein
MGFLASPLPEKPEGLMSTKNDRSFRASVDVLERRDLLSSVHSSSHVFSNIGFGTAEILSYSDLPGGGYRARGTLHGVSNSFGRFSGTISGTVSPTYVGNAKAVLHAADGDVLDLSITGSYKDVRGSNWKLTGTFTYTVTGGTGEFAHATGHGPLYVTANLATNAVAFSFSGKIKT